MSRITKLEQCPNCSAIGKDTNQDNLTTYIDGGKYCHACGYTESNNTNMVEKEESLEFLGNLLKGGVYEALPERCISKKICEFFNYQTGVFTGILSTGLSYDKERVHIENYFNSYMNVVAQKIRVVKDKKFGIRGSSKDVVLFGEQCFAPNPNLHIVVTEGAIDAMSVAEMYQQVKGTIFPVVSIGNGANPNTYKELAKRLDYLQGFKYVVLAFDNDIEGKEAVEGIIKNAGFEVGKIRVAKLQLKDANEYLKAGKQHEFLNLLWNAEAIKPKFLVKPNDLTDKVLAPAEHGISFPWPTMTKLTYGLRSKEIYIIVGSEGTGKSAMVNDLIAHFTSKDLKVGIFSFEEPPERTIKKIVGAKIGVKLYLPDQIYDENQVREEVNKLQDKLFLCSQAGSINSTELLNAIRYWAKIEGVKLIVIDNMKGLALDADNENSFYKKMMLKFQALVQELDITILLVSHVSKDTISKQTYVSTSPKSVENFLTSTDTNKLLQKPGLSWETGRMPESGHIEGTKSIPSLANYIFAVARNYMSDDPVEKNTLRVKCLKAKYEGAGMGGEFNLFYNSAGKLEELSNTDDII